MTEQRLRDGLNLGPNNVTLLFSAYGMVSFVNASGQPVSVTGTFTLSGEKLSFVDVEGFRIATG